MEKSKRTGMASLGRGLVLGAVALAGMSLAGGGDARAANLKTLWNFCAQGTATCPDGQFPNGVIGDGSGGLYGSALLGGAYGQGTVFQLVRNQSANGQPGWTLKTIYAFCAEGGAACTDGAQPVDWNLFKDQWGNLYGTTINGGANTAYANPSNSYLGTVFELSPKVGADGKTTWTHKILHNFCAEGGAKCTDGKAPVSQLIADAWGNLYGTATEGGVENPNCIDGSCGVVFELVRNRGADGQNAWTYKILHTFCEQGGPCADGQNPHPGLLMAADGRIYGETTRGGVNTGPGNAGGGTVYQLTPRFNDDGQRKWAFKLLYSFCARPNCSDGQYPNDQNLLMDEEGNLYGDAFGAGIRNPNCAYPPNVPASEAGCGVVFELTPNIAKTQWAERVVYSFCQQGGANCTDGANPSGGLIRDAAGRLFGVTMFGGAHAVFPFTFNGPFSGTVLRLTPRTNGAGETSWSEEVLYSFCAQGGSNCTDGAGPFYRLTLEPGHLLRNDGLRRRRLRVRHGIRVADPWGQSGGGGGRQRPQVSWRGPIVGQQDGGHREQYSRSSCTGKFAAQDKGPGGPLRPARQAERPQSKMQPASLKHSDRRRWFGLSVGEVTWRHWMGRGRSGIGSGEGGGDDATRGTAAASEGQAPDPPA
jgi:hypothetical protein